MHNPGRPKTTTERPLTHRGVPAISAHLTAEVAANHTFSASVALVSQGIVKKVPSAKDIVFATQIPRHLPGNTTWICVGPAADEQAIRHALRAGATTAVSWTTSPNHIHLALLAARHGLSLISQPTAQQLTQRTLTPPSEPLLTPDQRQLLNQVASGATAMAIAHCLGYSDRTVRRKLRELWDILGCNSRSTGLIKAAQYGLVSTEIGS